MKKFLKQISKTCKDYNTKVIEDNGHFLTKWGTFKLDTDPETGKELLKKRGKRAS